MKCMEKLLGEKRRYKLYKAKSKWVVSAIITISGVTFLVTSPVSNAQADTVNGSESVKTEATQASSSSVQNNATAQTTVTTNSNSPNNVSNVQTDTVKEATTSDVDSVASQNQATTAQQAKTIADTADQTVPPTTYKDHVKGNVQTAWDNGYKGQGMVVAVIDSGADTNHKDFSKAPESPAISKEDADKKISELGYGKYASEKFPFVYNYASRDNNWVKDDGPGASEHGQHVTGIIGADGQPNGNERYAVGVAPETQLMMMRVFNDQFADENTDDIAQAIYDAVKLGANVIQMSLGQGVAAANLNDVEQKAVEYATQHGVFVSISASNNGNSASVDGEKVPYEPGGADGNFEPFSSSTVANPGASRNAMTVAAENSVVGDGDDMADFSSWGPLQDFTLKPDVSAPGVSVTSTGNDNRYNTMSGTSMAGPFNAGVAALVMQRLKATTNLSGADLVQATKALIMNTAKPMTQQGYDTPVSPRRQGAGEIDAGAATESPVYVVAADGTSSVSLRKVGDSTQFALTFKNLSDKDQTYTFNDFGGGLTEVRDADTGTFHDVYLAGAHVYGDKTVTVKAGQSATYNFTLSLTGLKENQLVEGWLRFVGNDGQNQLVVPYLAYYGDMTSEDVFDKAANQEGTVYGGNYFVNEDNYPRGVADEDSLKALVNLEGNYNWQQVAKLYQDGKVAFSPNADGKSDLLKPYAFVKQNLKDLKVEVLDKNGKVVRVVADEQGLDKSYYESGVNKDVTLSVSMRNNPNTLAWDGKVYDDKTGEMVNAADGEYTYRYVATLYNDGANKVQTADYPVVIDTTAPVLSNVKYDATTHTLSFDYKDTGSGFTDYSYAVVKVNDKTFGYKLNDGKNSKFLNAAKTSGTFKAVLDSDTLAALTAAKNALSVAVSDVADNTSTVTLLVNGNNDATTRVSVWNATNGLELDQSSPDYQATTSTYNLRGNATSDFYYNGALVQVDNSGNFVVPVSTSDTAVVFTSDAAGKNVVYKLNTATPKAVFAWQVNNTVKENFGIVLDTVVSNNKDDVVVQAAVTKGDNVEAYARDYFTGAVYKADVKDGLATFHVKVTNNSGRTVLLGWTEVVGPTFNDVQQTSANGVYLGVDAYAGNPAPAPAFTNADQLGTNVVQEQADSATIGNPGDLPGHSLKDLTTRADANPDIHFDYLKDNDYNWVGAQAVKDGVYNPSTQVFTLTGKVDPNVKSLVVLGDSYNEADPVNKVNLNSDGTFSFQFHTAPTSQRPVAYIYTKDDGSTTRGTMELILDTVLPTLSLNNVTNLQLDSNGDYQVYTNNKDFSVSGEATDNLDGYCFFFNGDNDYREFHNSGVNFVTEAHQDGSTVTNPYPAYKFSKTFNLADTTGETTHVYTLSVVDLTGNTVTRKFYVHYQPASDTVKTVTTDKDGATKVLVDYSNNTLQVKDNTGSWVNATGVEAAKDYRVVNEYGNVVLLLNVLVDKEQDNNKVQVNEVTNNKVEQTVVTKTVSNKSVAKVGKKAAEPVKVLPQTGENNSKSTSVLGAVLASIAGFLGALGLRRVKKD